MNADQVARPDGTRTAEPLTVPDLRIMEVPANKLGLGVGTWLRWDELRVWLEARDDRPTIEAIEHQLSPEMTVSQRAIQVRQ